MFSHLHCQPKWPPAWRACLLCPLFLMMPVCIAQDTGTPAGQGSKIAPATAAATGNPDSKMMAGKVRYCSIFTQYQRLNQQTVTPWRESNLAVQQAGGWMALAQEAHAPEPASTGKLENCPPGVAAAHGEKP